MRDQVRSAMRALLSGYGCLDAAAAVLDARWGQGGSKGTLSKKASGQLSFTVEDVIALEDGLGRFPVTRLLAQRLGKPGAIPVDDLCQGAGDIAREAGEAVAAILAAVTSGRSGDRAQALVEIDEAIVQLEAARGALRMIAAGEMLSRVRS
ncbi:hypothetical protein [Roseicyclus marinus]|uniref:hypothetical protein n=1 Tax=Roseicyclus marinus TaxID=2161673 RepID=UPI00241035A6|nr:hypothetical protein [Roseicyclus marinus]MDG3040458.1 hypothetical protein [Roseicyclus marinus]